MIGILWTTEYLLVMCLEKQNGMVFHRWDRSSGLILDIDVGPVLGATKWLNWMDIGSHPNTEMVQDEMINEMVRIQDDPTTITNRPFHVRARTLVWNLAVFNHDIRC